MAEGVTPCTQICVFKLREANTETALALLCFDDADSIAPWSGILKSFILCNCSIFKRTVTLDVVLRRVFREQLERRSRCFVVSVPVLCVVGWFHRHELCRGIPEKYEVCKCNNGTHLINVVLSALGGPPSWCYYINVPVNFPSYCNYIVLIVKKSQKWARIHTTTLH